LLLGRHADDIAICAAAPLLGRKSKRFNGYKRHLAADIDTRLILACAITPANRPEEEATPELKADISRGPESRDIDQLYIDRGMSAANSSKISSLEAAK
jgi:hypothetical protein